MPFDKSPIPKKFRPSRATRWQSDSSTSKAGADAAEHRAQTQAEKILLLLEALARKGLTSDQIYDQLNEGIDQGVRAERMKRIPKGSIRRATSVLATKGLICELAEKRRGEHKTPLIVWVLMKFATPEERAAQDTKLEKRSRRRPRSGQA